MKLLLEQLFYGRGERGYGILGESPGAALFRKRVEMLCGAVGTPTAGYGGEPFLISAPEGDRVVMLCGRRGTPDSMKRETLFFHALVAEKSVLAAAKADAFTLFALGAFAAALPRGEISALSIDARGKESVGAASCRAQFPCFIRSGKPENDAVRSLVGMNANELTWASFAFQSIPGFDIQVLPPRSPAPSGANEYDESGKFVRASKAIQSKPEGNIGEDPYARQNAEPPSPIQQKPSAMLKVSLLLNIVLLALCATLFSMRKSACPDLPSDAPVATNSVSNADEGEFSADKKTAIENAAIEAYRSKLAQGMPRIEDLRSLPGFEGIAGWEDEREMKKQEAYATLLKFEALLKQLTNNPNKEDNNP